MQHPLPTRLEIDDLGYPTWLACFEELVLEDLHNQPAIEFQWDPHDYPGSNKTVEMDRIKSGAFDEIFPNLPTVGAMQVMLDVINSEPSIQQRQLLLEFFNKIPTRAQ
jgi:hypothetical protein